MKTYEDGLNEAWELARKMYQFNPINNKQLCEELYDMGFNEFICSTTASEAIKQVKEYKEKQEEIKIGDEVTDDDGWNGVVTWIDPDGEYLIILQKDGTALHWKKESFKKTGRHFTEIEEVLKQMQEGEE